ncbi:MAG TPA: hypothetical protein VFV54_06095, partial [Thermoanaerobaculia bacterium]|nr:hypothetical protein [Thermoanaerobaculia bacterium]
MSLVSINDQRSTTNDQRSTINDQRSTRGRDDRDAIPLLQIERAPRDEGLASGHAAHDLHVGRRGDAGLHVPPSRAAVLDREDRAAMRR